MYPRTGRRGALVPPRRPLSRAQGSRTGGISQAAAGWFCEFAPSEPRDDQVRSAFSLAVFFGHHLPGELLVRVVQENRLRLERRLLVLRQMGDLLREDSSLPGATLRRAALRTATVIDWTDDLLDRLSDGGGD